MCANVDRTQLHYNQANTHAHRLYLLHDDMGVAKSAVFGTTFYTEIGPPLFQLILNCPVKYLFSELEHMRNSVRNPKHCFPKCHGL